jgi:hypothetical protein
VTGAVPDAGVVAPAGEEGLVTEADWAGADPAALVAGLLQAARSAAKLATAAAAASVLAVLLKCVISGSLLR